MCSFRRVLKRVEGCIQKGISALEVNEKTLDTDAASQLRAKASPVSCDGARGPPTIPTTRLPPETKPEV